MNKLGVIAILVVLSFFINILYYVAWMLMDHWLIAPETPATLSAVPSTV